MSVQHPEACGVWHGAVQCSSETCCGLKSCVITGSSTNKNLTLRSRLTNGEDVRLLNKPVTSSRRDVQFDYELASLRNLLNKGALRKLLFFRAGNKTIWTERYDRWPSGQSVAARVRVAGEGVSSMHEGQILSISRCQLAGSAESSKEASSQEALCAPHNPLPLYEAPCFPTKRVDSLSRISARAT